MQYVINPGAANIQPFAWWEGAFTDQELNWLQGQAKNASNPGEVGGLVSGVNTGIRRSQVSWLQNTPETLWVFEKLARVVSEINAKYYQFDLVGFGESLQLTNYDQSEHGMYGWHQDYGTAVSRKLSVTVQLTDPSEYEGGNLQIMTSGQPVNIKKQRGFIAVFPSYIVHQVTPVTQGSRQSLVAWVSGPPFK
jgi:hypothetical protein